MCSVQSYKLLMLDLSDMKSVDIEQLYVIELNVSMYCVFLL